MTYAREQLGFVFQQHHLFDDLTVTENLAARAVVTEPSLIPADEPTGRRQCTIRLRDGWMEA